MTDWIQWSNRTSAAWADWLWPLCWQAAVVVAVAWVLTLLLRRSSPWLRSWIWRLAYLKLIVLMVWSTPIKLAVLPAAPPADANSKLIASSPDNSGRKVEATNSAAENTVDDNSVQSRSGETAPDAVVSEESAHATVVEPSDTHTTDIHTSDINTSKVNAERPIESQKIAAPTMAAAPPPVEVPAPVRLSLVSYLCAAWLIGLIAVVGWLAFEIWRTLRLRRSIRLIDQPELESLVREVRSELKLRSSVRLGESDLTHGPMLVKFVRPIVVFPAGMLASNEQRANLAPTEKHDDAFAGQLTRDEIRLVLAHEMAHLKRYDLTWNALAAVIHVLLYFHPLVWAAHRLARQEQELACDELVVTRLGVKRHEYGQMLVKIVRQIGRGFRPGIAVVGMSASYETLSRRIEAMTHIHVWNRKQIAMLGLVMVAVSLVAIVPWQVVAQDATPAVPQETKEPATKGNETKSGETTSDATPKSQIVGAWHGVVGSTNTNSGSGNDSEIVFRPDGTYLDYSMRLFAPGPGAYTTDRGRWTIDGKRLTLIADLPALPWLEGFSTSKPTESTGVAPEPQKRVFAILLLDDSLLRLKAPGPTPVAGGTAVLPGMVEGGFFPGMPGAVPPSNSGYTTYFYRRDKSVPADQKYDPSIPKQLRHIAELAGLTPPEALELAKHVKQLNEKLTKAGGKELDMEWVERVAEARDGKLNFQKLFQLTDAEVKAFASLMQLTDMHFQGAMNLLNQDQLTATEASAVKKMFDLYANSLVTAFSSTAETLVAQADPQSKNVWLGISPAPAGGVQENPFGAPGAALGGLPAGAPGIATGGFPAANAEMSVNAKMLAKMQNYVQGQATWLSATVFDR